MAVAAAWAWIRMMDLGAEEASTPNGPFAAGVLLWLEGHTVSDMQPLLHAHASQYRLVLMGPEKAVGTSWWGIADGPLDRYFGASMRDLDNQHQEL